MAAPGATPEGRPSGTLPNVDVRDSMKPAPAFPAATARLERSLGDQGVVALDEQTGGAAFVGRTDGFLTGRSADSPADVVLGYVADHLAGLGLRSADLATLELEDSHTAVDGVTYVTYAQRASGIESYDTYLKGAVDKQGRLINVTGAPPTELAVDSLVPKLSADEALLAARADVGGSAALPAVEGRSGGPERATDYSTYAESARLSVFAQPGTDRLAWKVLVLDADSLLYQVAVDAQTGRILARQSLTAFDSYDARVWPDHPDQAVAPTLVNFGTDPTWLDRSAANGNQLIGNNAQAYHDDNGTNGYQVGEEVVRNSATGDWTYPMTWYSQAGCPAAGCTWDSAIAGSRATNRSAGTVAGFYLANRFHDYLLAPPIGFDEASGNFEQVNSTGTGLGGDAVLVETHESSGMNNANFSTPPDGSPGRMQMYLWDGTSAAVGPQYDVDGAASADLVYHEYGHGLSSRLIGNGAGLGTLQSGAMGEAWSDFFALDLLVAEGQRPDPVGPGDVWLGEYVTGVPGIFGGISRIRHQAIDCTVGADGSSCPASGTAGSGGYTFGDLGKVGTTNGIHDGGEIWSQTLWDLRAALGRTDALKVIVGGMRLSPANPSMLAMRDAILQAANTYGVSPTTVWSVFAARGFGFFASTASASANSATEDFSLPPALIHVSTVIDDSAPRGDGDGQAEPGETLVVRTSLQNLTTAPISDVTGTVTTNAGIPVARAATSWPTIAPSAILTEDPPLAVTVPPTQACGTSFDVSVAASSATGPIAIPTATVAVAATPVFTAATDVPKAIPDNNAAGVNSVFTFPTDGTVSDLDVRIGSITHTWVGDLRITLTHDGTTVVLANRPGAGTSGSSGDNFVDLVLDDEATSPIEGIGNAGPFTGRYRPDELLSAFDGDALAGTWTLNVSDNATTDTGSLQSWALSPISECDVFPQPEPVTGAASDVATTSATLNGTLDANGVPTDYRFDWGTTGAYGSSTTVTAGGTATDPTGVAAALSGLTPSTDYHARLVALRDGLVMATGADRVFRTADLPTPPEPPTPPQPPTQPETQPETQPQPPTAPSGTPPTSQTATVPWPSPVTTLKAQVLGAETRRIRLTWLTPDSPPAPTYFKVRVKVGKQPWRTAAFVTGNRLVLKKVKAGTVYRFKVATGTPDALARYSHVVKARVR